MVKGDPHHISDFSLKRLRSITTWDDMILDTHARRQICSNSSHTFILSAHDTRNLTYLNSRRWLDGTFPISICTCIYLLDTCKSHVSLLFLLQSKIPWVPSSHSLQKWQHPKWECRSAVHFHSIVNLSCMVPCLPILMLSIQGREWGCWF